jgi:hypothetical protein
MLTLLMILGLSSSVYPGLTSPGLVAEAVVQGQHRLGWESVTTLDAAQQSRGSGWTLGQSLDMAAADLGPVGLLVGADYQHRVAADQGTDAVWLRSGFIRTRNGQTIRAVIRATAWASDRGRNAAAQVEYRRNVGRLVLATTQGVMLHNQPTRSVGYYGTVTMGVTLRSERGYE